MISQKNIDTFVAALTTHLTEGRQVKVGVDVIPGRKYTKITHTVGDGRSVYCFINNTNGDVYKPAGWKAPELNVARGNILGEDMLKGCGVYGVDYLK